VTVPGRVEAHAGVVTIAAGALPLLRLRIPSAPLLSCPPDSATVGGGGIRVSCSIERIPAELVS